MGARAAERVVRRLGLVGNVLDQVGAVRHVVEILADRQAQHAIGRGGRHLGCRIDVDPAVLGEIGIDRHAVHPGLTVAEQIVRNHGVAVGAAHAEKLMDVAIRHADRKALANLGEEHRAVVEKGDVPGNLQPLDHHLVPESGRVHPLPERWSAAGHGRGGQQSGGEGY